MGEAQSQVDLPAFDTLPNPVITWTPGFVNGVF